MTLTRPEAAASDVLGGPYISANYRMRPTAHGAWADHLPTDPAAPAPTPHRAGDPSRPPDIVGREAELAAAANTLDGSRNVVVTGDLGVGKTALLKVVAYARHHVEEHGASYLPAGVLPVDDLLQCLYLRFFDEPLLKGNLRAQRLRGVDALVALDDVTYGDEEFAALEEAFSPGALVVARAGRPAGNTWNAMSLAGLSDDAGLALFQRKLGRQVVGRERQLARKVVRHLAGNPLRIERVATLQRETTWPLGRILTIAEGGPTAEVDELRSRLSSGDERLLEVLASLYPHIAGEDVLGAMLERFEPRLALPRFERWGLALAYSPRYRVPADVAARAEGALHPDDEMALLDGLVRWTERHRDQRSVITAEAGVVTHVLERAVAREDWDGVERLGHAVDEPLMLTGLWGTWEQALDRQLVAGRAAGNRALEAWAQHQLGTRAMGLGDLVKAKADLTQALRLRVGTGDFEGARVTRHNLGLLGPGPMRYAAPPPPPPPAAPEPRRPFPPPWWLLILPPLLVLGGLAILLFRGGDGGDPPPGRNGRLTVAPVRLDFGDQDVGTASPVRTVTVSNRSPDPVLVRRVVAEGSSSADFPVRAAGCAAAPLQPDATCDLEVAFVPGAAGPSRASLVVETDGGSRSEVALTGGGRPLGRASVRVEPRSLAFGSVGVGTLTGPQSVSVVNTGTTDVRVNRIRVLPDTAPQDFFVDSNACGGALRPGGRCTFLVRARPGQGGLRFATVAVETTSSPRPESVALVLEGTGVPTGPTFDRLAPQTVRYGDRFSAPVAAREGTAGGPLRITAVGLPSGIDVLDRGDGTATVTGDVTAAAGVYPSVVTVTDPARRQAQAEMRITVERARVGLQWINGLELSVPGPAQGTVRVTPPPNSGADLAGAVVAFTFRDMLSGAVRGTATATPTADGVASGLAPSLPVGLYLVDAQLDPANTFFESTSHLSGALAVSTDLAGATVYLLSTLGSA